MIRDLIEELVSKAAADVLVGDCARKRVVKRRPNTRAYSLLGG